MLGLVSNGKTLDTVIHIIQVALTPVFLLTGIATLLNVFSTRLARVADRVDQFGRAIEGADVEQMKALTLQLAHLNRRSLALDIAVILAAFGGAATCAAVLALFVGALRNSAVASALVVLFGLAVLCALGAIVAFTAEMLIAGIGIRAELAQTRRAPSREGDFDAPEGPEHPDEPGTAAPPDGA
jgi:hypothetical protein